MTVIKVIANADCQFCLTSEENFHEHITRGYFPSKVLKLEKNLKKIGKLSLPYLLII